MGKQKRSRDVVEQRREAQHKEKQVKKSVKQVVVEEDEELDEEGDIVESDEEEMDEEDGISGDELDEGDSRSCCPTCSPLLTSHRVQKKRTTRDRKRRLGTISTAFPPTKRCHSSKKLKTCINRISSPWRCTVPHVSSLLMICCSGHGAAQRSFSRCQQIGPPGTVAAFPQDTPRRAAVRNCEVERA